MARASAASIGTPQDRVPHDAVQFVEAFRFQFLSYLRTYRFLGLLILTLLVTALIAGLTLSQGVGNISADFSGQVDSFLMTSLSFVSFLVILAASFFGGDALSVDFGSATGYYTLVLPVRRPVLLSGRYAAAFAASAVLVLAHYALIGALAAVIFGGVGGLFFESLGLALLYTAAVLSFAFVLGALFRRPVVAVVATVLAMVFVLPIVVFGVEQAGYEPYFIVTYAGDAITNLFQPIVHESSVAAGGIGFTIWNATVPEATAIMLAYAIVGYLLALVVYQRKEVTG